MYNQPHANLGVAESASYLQVKKHIFFLLGWGKHCSQESRTFYSSTITSSGRIDCREVPGAAHWEGVSILSGSLYDTR